MRYVSARPMGRGVEKGPKDELGRWKPGFFRARMRARRGEDGGGAENPTPPEGAVSGPFDELRRRPPPPRRWGPQTPLGPNLRVEAAEGFRSAIIELRPGLFIVAEVPEATLQGEFGAIGLLAPLLVNSAARALTTPITVTTPVTTPAAPSPVATALVTTAVETALAPRQTYEDEGFDTRWALPAPARWSDAETVAGTLGYHLPAPGGRS